VDRYQFAQIILQRLNIPSGDLIKSIDIRLGVEENRITIDKFSVFNNDNSGDSDEIYDNMIYTRVDKPMDMQLAKNLFNIKDWEVDEE